MVIFLHRPSPQIPEPSASAARICVAAALYNIRLQREQIANKSVDLTWVFTQTLFMELNTVLWALSYPEVRRENPRQEIEEYVQLAKDGTYISQTLLVCRMAVRNESSWSLEKDEWVVEVPPVFVTWWISRTTGSADSTTFHRHRFSFRTMARG